MSGADQAAGLRRWVQARHPRDEAPTAAEMPLPPAPAQVRPPEKTTLMLVGLKDGSSQQLARAKAVLAHWAAEGKRWVGEVDTWRLVPVAADSDYLELLVGQQRRWALWVDTDEEGFRRAYRVLQQLSRQPGPKRLLVLHPPLRSSRGLLNNIRQAAAELFGIELLILLP